VALWFTVSVRRSLAIVASSLVMGVAVAGMHYTGMFAMEVHLHGTGGPLSGSTVYALVLPIVLLVIFALVGLVYAVLAAPTDEDRAGAAYLDERIAHRQQAPNRPTGGPSGVGLAGRAGSSGAAAPGEQRVNGRPGPNQGTPRRQTVPRAHRTRRS